VSLLLLGAEQASPGDIRIRLAPVEIKDQSGRVRDGNSLTGLRRNEVVVEGPVEPDVGGLPGRSPGGDAEVDDALLIEPAQSVEGGRRPVGHDGVGPDGEPGACNAPLPRGRHTVQPIDVVRHTDDLTGGQEAPALAARHLQLAKLIAGDEPVLRPGDSRHPSG
jgi:hypothetical protein